jgi:bacteriocin-like protein
MNEKNEIQVKELSKEEMENVEGGKMRHDFRVALPQGPQFDTVVPGTP